MSSQPWRNISMYAEVHEIKEAVQQITKIYICQRCNTPFTISNSLGCLQCFQHPGKLELQTNLTKKWSCCGKLQPQIRYNNNQNIYSLYQCNTGTVPFQPPPPSQGCTPADHTNLRRPYVKNDNINSIASIAGIIPQLNSDQRITERKGFDHGEILRSKPTFN